jgi:hypothetical protein
MSTVWRWLSRVLLVLLLLVAIVAAIWGYGRMTSPSAAQREAVALMQAPPASEGENGFPLLLDLPPPPDGLLPEIFNCGDAGRPCIAAIETAPEASAAAIEPYRLRLEAASRALHAPVFRDLRTDAGAEALPAYAPIMQLDSLRSLDFAAGNTLGALSAACEDALGAARWARSPNTLLDGMVGIAAFRQHAALIADMRRRAPGDALPASCTALAVAPDAAAEGTLCQAMRGEYRFLETMLGSMGADMPVGSGPEWMRPLLHDDEWLMARTAERYAGTCGPAAEAAVREDRAAGFSGVARRWVDHVAFPVSVVLDKIAEPAYLDYADRQLDFVAQRRLLAALLQMDAMPATLAPAERFAALPADLRDGPRPLVLADDGASLSVPQRSRRSEQEGRELRLPLPAAAAPVVATPPLP